MLKSKINKLFLIFGVILFSLVGVVGCSNQTVNSTYISTNFEEDTVEINHFYTLQEAYNMLLLSIEDLEKIASYHNNGKQDNDNLNLAVINEIKKIAAYNFQNDEFNPVLNAKAEDFSITKYYGTYNNIIVFMINNPYFEFPTEDLEIIENIAGIDFYYSSNDRILVFVNT